MVEQVKRPCRHGLYDPHGGCDCYTTFLLPGGPKRGRWIQTTWLPCKHAEYCDGGTVLESTVLIVEDGFDRLVEQGAAALAAYRSRWMTWQELHPATQQIYRNEARAVLYATIGEKL